jgi:hypothetical protein
VHPLCEETSGLIRTTIWPDRILSRVAGREERKHQECLYKPQRPTSFPILKTFSSRTSSSFFVHLCLHQIPLERTFIAHLSIDFTYQASSPARYHFAIFNPILILAISPKTNSLPILLAPTTSTMKGGYDYEDCCCGDTCSCGCGH